VADHMIGQGDAGDALGLELADTEVDGGGRRSGWRPASGLSPSMAGIVSAAPGVVITLPEQMACAAERNRKPA
jgi:hypothetical protein